MITFLPLAFFYIIWDNQFVNICRNSRVDVFYINICFHTIKNILRHFLAMRHYTKVKIFVGNNNLCTFYVISNRLNKIRYKPSRRMIIHTIS